jgi:hypothetical protein
MLEIGEWHQKLLEPQKTLAHYPSHRSVISRMPLMPCSRQAEILRSYKEARRAAGVLCRPVVISHTLEITAQSYPVSCMSRSGVSWLTAIHRERD